MFTLSLEGAVLPETEVWGLAFGIMRIGTEYSWVSWWKCTRLLETHELAESNGKGHAWAPTPAGCLTQHNPGVIKHDKKQKGKGLVLTRVHSAQAPQGSGYSEVPAVLNFIGTKVWLT